jgi:hypothetical protein
VWCGMRGIRRGGEGIDTAQCRTGQSTTPAATTIAGITTCAPEERE